MTYKRVPFNSRGGSSHWFNLFLAITTNLYLHAWGHAACNWSRLDIPVSHSSPAALLGTTSPYKVERVDRKTTAWELGSSSTSTSMVGVKSRPTKSLRGILRPTSKDAMKYEGTKKGWTWDLKIATVIIKICWRVEETRQQQKQKKVERMYAYDALSDFNTADWLI